MKYIILIILMLSIFSCRKIEDNQWKYSDGCNSFGDWVEFDEKNIKKDTISLGGKPVAVIKSYKYRLTDYQLEIVDIKTNSIGYYCSKGRKKNEIKN